MNQRKSSFNKILDQHTLSEPGTWTVQETQAETWMETVIQPILHAIPDCSIRFEQPSTYSSRTKKTTDYHPVKVIGAVRLAPLVSTHYQDSREYSSLTNRHIGSVSVGLLWVYPETGGMPVPATAISMLHTRESSYSSSYYAGPSRNNEDLRYFQGPEQLQNMLMDMAKELNQVIFRQQKKLKVKKLQIHAIKAHIQQIANTEGFAFNIKTSALMINILIRINRGNQLKISVPFTEFENALPELRETVLKLRALNERRISFRIEQQPYRGTDWIEPEASPNTGETV